MRNRNTDETTQPQDPTFDHDIDHHPTAVEALRRIIEEGDLYQGPVELIEIRCSGSGEVTWRTRAPRAEETEVGYLYSPIAGRVQG